MLVILWPQVLDTEKACPPLPSEKQTIIHELFTGCFFLYEMRSVNASYTGMFISDLFGNKVVVPWIPKLCYRLSNFECSECSIRVS